MDLGVVQIAFGTVFAPCRRAPATGGVVHVGGVVVEPCSRVIAGWKVDIIANASSIPSADGGIRREADPIVARARADDFNWLNGSSGRIDVVSGGLGGLRPFEGIAHQHPEARLESDHLIIGLLEAVRDRLATRGPLGRLLD